MEPTIAFIAGQLSGGGAERQLLYLLRGLTAYPIRVVLANLRPGDPGEAAVEALGIPVQRIPPSRWKVDRLLRLAAWLRRERPLLVHSWVFSGNTYAAWGGALAGVPARVGSLRGDAFYENTVQWKAPPLFLRLGLETPHAVVVNSAAAAAAIAQRGPNSARIRVVPNGIDLGALRAAAAGESPDRIRTERDSSGPVLALVGNLIPRKNAPMFLRVIAGLQARYPGIEGWLIGDGPERRPLETLADEIGVADRIRFWGQRADVARLVARADILCHCSHSEGLSNAIMEASGLGVPVVATRAGGTDEIIEDGVTGFLVDADDDGAMAGFVGQLLRDPDRRARIGMAGRQKMEREFAVEQMVKNIMAVYRDLLDGKAPRSLLTVEP
jgi:glycosyltransferase involved in cell wall biosynthesis